MNPDVIDPNYFYGKLLIDQGENAKAITGLEHAFAAPDRPNREVFRSVVKLNIRGNFL